MKRVFWIGVGVTALGMAIVFLGLLPMQLVRAHAVPVAGSPADVGVAFEELTIRVEEDDLSLSAWWMPAREATSTVLFIHGANANKEDFYFGALDYYGEIVARGHHVLAVDLRNHGDSDASETGRLTFGREEYRDVLAALDYVERLAPGLPIIGSGVSMGGAVLIEAAAHDPRIEALLLFDPLLDTTSGSRGGMYAITGLPEAILAPTLWSAAYFFGLKGEREPLEVAAQLAIPILLIQDPDDPITRFEFADELSKRNSDVLLHVVPSVPQDDPRIIESGRWGSHGKAFRIHGDESMAEIDRFLFEF